MKYRTCRQPPPLARPLHRDCSSLSISTPIGCCVHLHSPIVHLSSACSAIRSSSKSPVHSRLSALPAAPWTRRQHSAPYMLAPPVVGKEVPGLAVIKRLQPQLTGTSYVKGRAPPGPSRSKRPGRKPQRTRNSRLCCPSRTCSSCRSVREGHTRGAGASNPGVRH